VSGVTPARALTCSPSGTATLECLGIAVLELNLKLVGHILFQFDYLKLKIRAGVYYKDCNVVLGHSYAIFGYFNVVLGDSTTIYLRLTIIYDFTRQYIFHLNDEVMEEVCLELVSSSASSQDTHFSLCSFSRNCVGIVFVLSTIFSCLQCDLLSM
jgi:hypothetical protein